jgi:ribosomal RNA-processing protein 9
MRLHHVYSLCNYAENGTCKSESFSSAHSWVSAVASRKGSDLAASGAANGVIRLWTIQPDSKGMQPLFDLPLVFVLS